MSRISLLIILAVAGVSAFFIMSKQQEVADVSELDVVTAPETTRADDTDVFNNDRALDLPAPEVTPETLPQAQDTTSAPTYTPPPTTTAPPITQPVAVTSPEPYIPRSVIVLYDGGRFVPDEITVVKDATVRFVNTSDTVLMWVASDNHPTHSRYPRKDASSCSGYAFDQCEGVSQGGEWGFTFDRIGTWGYHNHERAKDRAKVKVVSEEEYIKHHQ